MYWIKTLDINEGNKSYLTLTQIFCILNAMIFYRVIRRLLALFVDLMNMLIWSQMMLLRSKQAQMGERRCTYLLSQFYLFPCNLIFYLNRLISTKCCSMVQMCVSLFLVETHCLLDFYQLILNSVNFCGPFQIENTFSDILLCVNEAIFQSDDI